jgi:hypothetical protein
VDADCSLGLSMLGLEVEHVAEWGPAYFSGLLRPGDKVRAGPNVACVGYNGRLRTKRRQSCSREQGNQRPVSSF